MEDLFQEVQRQGINEASGERQGEEQDGGLMVDDTSPDGMIATADDNADGDVVDIDDGDEDGAIDMVEVRAQLHVACLIHFNAQ